MRSEVWVRTPEGIAPTDEAPAPPTFPTFPPSGPGVIPVPPRAPSAPPAQGSESQIPAPPPGGDSGHEAGPFPAPEVDVPASRAAQSSGAADTEVREDISREGEIPTGSDVVGLAGAPETPAAPGSGTSAQARRSRRIRDIK